MDSYQDVKHRTSAAVATIAQEKTLFHQLEELYIFREPGKVRAFLEGDVELISFLLEAYGQLLEYFGVDSQVVLQVVSDPEAESVETLFAYIASSLPVDEALARLDRFDEGWLLDRLDRIGTRLNFNLEFT